jgi:hypothetical protein
MEAVINYWAVLLAAIVCVALGATWFGPLFGKVWMKAIDVEMPKEITKAMQRAMMRSYALVALSAFVMAFVLAHFLEFASAYMDTDGALAGATGAIWAWVGFVVPATLGSVLWEGRSWKYWFVTAGYWLVALIVTAVILSVWR